MHVRRQKLILAGVVGWHNITILEPLFSWIQFGHHGPLSTRRSYLASACILCFGWGTVGVFKCLLQVSAIEAIAPDTRVITMIASIGAHLQRPTSIDSRNVVLVVVRSFSTRLDVLLTPRANIGVVRPARVVLRSVSKPGAVKGIGAARDKLFATDVGTAAVRHLFWASGW